MKPVLAEGRALIACKGRPQGAQRRWQGQPDALKPEKENKRHDRWQNRPPGDMQCGGEQGDSRTRIDHEQPWCAISVSPMIHQPSAFSMRATVWLKSRSEEHTSELQSLMRISYAVFCL